MFRKFRKQSTDKIIPEIWELNSLEVACWMVTGERQAAKIRALYLKSILQQEIAYFDKEVSTGEVIGRMSGDTIVIQEAMGEKVVYL